MLRRPSIMIAPEERLEHSWLCTERLIRSILETRWDTPTWPTAKVTLKRAFEERKKIREAGWFS